MYIIISFSCLATALFVGAVASLTVIAITLKRSKAKTRAVFIQPDRAEETTHNEPAHKPKPKPSRIYTGCTIDIGPLPPASNMNTHTTMLPMVTQKLTAGAMEDVPLYEDSTDPIPLPLLHKTMYLMAVYNNYNYEVWRVNYTLYQARNCQLQHIHMYNTKEAPLYQILPMFTN
jgi:hypothetical protein